MSADSSLSVICRLESIIASPGCFAIDASMTELLAQAINHIRVSIDPPAPIPMLQAMGQRTVYQDTIGRVQEQ